MPNDTLVRDELRAQWSNPSDIMSLLMLVGGDIVQKALAQLVGVRISPRPTGPWIYLTPVAFSFGWVAYAFTSLSSVFGDCRLMPQPDTDIKVINLSNGYERDNNSWVLSRLLRDHESAVDRADLSADDKVTPNNSTGQVSLKIDIFIADPVRSQGPHAGKTWYVCWAIIVVQQVIAAIPWWVYGDWGIFLVTITGTFFALVTGALPQWTAEKWSAPLLRNDKTVALTRGNGHQYVMVIIGGKDAWDLEAMASARQNVRRETRWISLTLTLFWTLLLITVSGLGEHTWYLVGVGGLGMLQNIYMSATKMSKEAVNVRFQAYHDRPTITGYQSSSGHKQSLKDDDPDNTDTDADLGEDIPDPDVRDVMGALMELEKTIPKAGAALVPVFFPGSVEYEAGSLFFNREKKFWKRAFENVNPQRKKKKAGSPQSSSSGGSGPQNSKTPAVHTTASA